MFADLHLHTHYSDGTYTPSELAAHARKHGLSAVALTDHDTVEGCTPMALAFLGAFAVAASPVHAENAQQERMKTCNSKAADKKGDERKKFMSDCLSAEKKAYDSKMSECNTKSKGMKGDERKSFMSQCLKKAA